MESSNEQKSFSLKDYYRENLGRVFEHYLAEAIKSKKDSSINILSVGCGFGYEADPLLRIFPNAVYTGMDIDTGAISGAKEINNDLYERCEFQIADGRNKDAIGTKPWDIVILRNPQVSGSTFDTSKGSTTREDWRRILKNSIEVLGEGGMVFISVDEEHDRGIVLKHLNSFTGNVSIVVNEPNIYPSKKGVFKDSLIIMAKKIGER